MIASNTDSTDGIVSRHLSWRKLHTNTHKILYSFLEILSDTTTLTFTNKNSRKTVYTIPNRMIKKNSTVLNLSVASCGSIYLFSHEPDTLNWYEICLNSQMFEYNKDANRSSK